VRNERLSRLDVLVGDWKLTLSNAWFLDSLETELHGSATIEWLNDAFIVMKSERDREPLWDFVFGCSDATERYVALYHDDRGTSRVFEMTFGDGKWTLTREDPDFHQRFVADVGSDRIAGHWDASEDQGQTWRKDFDVVFERVPRTSTG
jgi:hypothetical protein